MFGSKIGDTNMSKGSIDNYINAKCITTAVYFAFGDNVLFGTMLVICIKEASSS